MIGKKAGLTEEEIARIKEGPDAKGWAPFDATLLRAADELHTDSVVSDQTWAALSERYNTEQLMDTVFAVGQYTLVSMSLNSFKVQLNQTPEDSYTSSLPVATRSVRPERSAAQSKASNRL